MSTAFFAQDSNGTTFKGSLSGFIPVYFMLIGDRPLQPASPFSSATTTVRKILGHAGEPGLLKRLQETLAAEGCSNMEIVKNKRIKCQAPEAVDC